MSFLVPGALALAVLALPIILFYMLKLRRQEVLVSSTMLWRRLLRDREANSPWQRLRRNLLLLLQLLILVLLVLALARPYRHVAAVARGNIVLLLDASASMRATDVAPTRFAAAQEVARGLIDGLGAGEVMTIISIGPSPRVLASTTGDKTALRRAVATASSTEGQADWQAALTLAAASAQATPRSTVVIVSDGGLPADLPDMPVPVTYVPVGRGDDNRAILALAVRDGAQGPQVFVRVANLGAAEATALVELAVDGQLFDARQLTLPPRDKQGLTFTGLPLDARQVVARLSGEDLLLVDDTAWAVRATSQPAQVILLSAGNVFLERALGLLPNVEVWKAGSLEDRRDAPNFPTSQPSNLQPSITVLDGLLTESLPPGNLLIVNPPHSTELFTVGEVFTATQVIRAESGDPLLRYVTWDDVHIARARLVTPPGWMRVLVQAEGGPLLLVGEREGRRVAVLTFDLHASDLPLKIAFPILMSNLVSWLAPTGGMEVPATLRPGDPLTLRPAMDATQLVVQSPSGQRWTYPVTGEPIPFAETTELGVYTVYQSSAPSASSAQSADQADHFAVNLFSEMESDIAPREVITIGAQQIAVPQEGLQGRQEWWRWLALAAVIVLLVEWWVHWRGGRLLY
ncbi:MAG: VWA domain-containing protein [Anaerolineae bacterium]|nr:VWA domain-containing protein [Anaerolineae bacterium]